MAVGAQVEDYREHPDGDIGQGKTCALPVRYVRNLDSQRSDSERSDSEHRDQHAHSEGDVVGVEAIGVEPETLPGDEDGHEERREDSEAAQGVVRNEFVRELGDGNDEHYIEEELEPGSVALVACVLFGECAKAGRTRPGLGGSGVSQDYIMRV
jgi:hypothetical protein